MPVAAGSAAPPAATGAQPVTFTAGQIVTVKFGLGNNPMNGKHAKVTSVLSTQCWVEFLEGSCTGTTKRIVKGNLTPVPMEPVVAGAPPAAETAAETAAVADAAAPAGTSVAGSEDDWDAAADVF